MPVVTRFATSVCVKVGCIYTPFVLTFLLLFFSQEQEAKSKRARWSTAKNNDNGDSFEGGPSPPTGGCGGGMGGAGGLGDLPRVVF